MRPYVAAVPVPQTMPTIDPEAQIALVVDGDGRTVGLGGHGPPYQRPHADHHHAR
ncbi:putative ATP-grasp-modified RiPP [Streptomyces albidoflavus]|uniref:putative ATP-grasp-modified RiPP n=1 Tax=Streptomyces albidoflavus TaxID=1886 RepID=UPI001E5C4A4B|nr:putative ATP-grasp-modified RiPP [Streptomyces albidoflavus]